MDKSRRTLLLNGCTMAATAFLPGCLTSSMYQNKRHKRYVETFTSVLVSKDEKHIVILAEDYHYIFDAPKQVINTLNASFHKSVEASFRNINIDRNNNISGAYTLKIADSLDSSQRKAAIAAGYKPQPGGALLINGVLNGKRYESGGMKVPGTVKQLNKYYTVGITTPANGAIERALLTPITVAADGVLLIASIPLVTYILIASGGKLDLR